MISIRTANLKAALLLNHNIRHQIPIVKELQLIQHQSYTTHLFVPLHLKTYEVAIANVCYVGLC